MDFLFGVLFFQHSECVTPLPAYFFVFCEKLAVNLIEDVLDMMHLFSLSAFNILFLSITFNT
jgi:hypothetical protein